MMLHLTILCWTSLVQKLFLVLFYPLLSKFQLYQPLFNNEVPLLWLNLLYFRFFCCANHTSLVTVQKLCFVSIIFLLVLSFPISRFLCHMVLNGYGYYFFRTCTVYKSDTFGVPFILSVGPSAMHAWILKLNVFGIVGSSCASTHFPNIVLQF